MGNLNEALQRAKEIMDLPMMQSSPNNMNTPRLSKSVAMAEGGNIYGAAGLSGMDGLPDDVYSAMGGRRETMNESTHSLFGDDIISEQYQDDYYQAQQPYQQRPSMVQRRQPQMMQESAQYQQPQMQQQMQPQIDYSMVKMIVEDVVKRYSAALKKSILSEMNESGVFRIGEKVQVVDKNGNLYEGKLTFKKQLKG